MKLKFVCHAFVFGLVLISGSTPSVAKVLGKDTRIAIPKDYRQLARGVGRLYDAGTRSSCTAFCVAPDVIVTNAHCVAWKLKKYKNRRRDVRDFHFRMIEDGRTVSRANLAWNNIEPIGRVETSVLFGRNSKSVLRRKSNDWALAKLNRPMCADNVLKIADARDFKLMKRRRKQKVFTIGFHGDKAKSERGYGKRFTRCVVRIQKIKGLAAHNCDAAPGSSGSPLFISTPQGPRVIAINQGGRGYYRWRRSRRTGKKTITKRWYTNYGVFVPRLRQRIERLRQVSFVHYSQRLEANKFNQLLRINDLLGKSRRKPNRRSVQAAIRRFEKKQGWIPLGIPSEQFVEALVAHPAIVSKASRVADREISVWTWSECSMACADDRSCKRIDYDGYRRCRLTMSHNLGGFGKVAAQSWSQCTAMCAEDANCKRFEYDDNDVCRLHFTTSPN